MWTSFLICGVLMILLAVAPGCNGNKTGQPPPTPFVLPVSDYGELDKNRVEGFLRAFKRLTLESSSEKRIQELDKRIREAGLSLADKIESVKRLAPPGDGTGGRTELRLDRLILSVAPEELGLFKFALEYDGDDKDLVEYVFHDLDGEDSRNRVIKHFEKAPAPIGVKVLTDVDDTMFANLIEGRYPKHPKKTPYPGVLEFYDSLRHEPFEAIETPVTTLSARPNPIAFELERASLRSLVEITERRLRPSALSGKLVSSVLGSLQTVRRANETPLDMLSDDISHGHEDEIGKVKFSNFTEYAQVYPEYAFVFVGDSGQADALTAQLMVTHYTTDQRSGVLATFIHDIRRSEGDSKCASNSFQNLLQRQDLLVNETSTSGRGVIVFRNYIQAAVIAYVHSSTLYGLITADELAAITKAALDQFIAINGWASNEDLEKLRSEYRQDAKRAYQLLTSADPKPTALEDVRRIVEGF